MRVSAGAVFSLKDPFVCYLRYRKPVLTGRVEKDFADSCRKKLRNSGSGRSFSTGDAVTLREIMHQMDKLASLVSVERVSTPSRRNRQWRNGDWSRATPPPNSAFGT